MGDRGSRSSFSQDHTYITEYMQEINDYITNSLYKELFAYPKRMNREQAEFQSIQEIMLQDAKPEIFDIPKEWLNPQNSQLWTRQFENSAKLTSKQRRIQRFSICSTVLSSSINRLVYSRHRTKISRLALTTWSSFSHTCYWKQKSTGCSRTLSK